MPSPTPEPAGFLGACTKISSSPVPPGSGSPGRDGMVWEVPGAMTVKSTFAGPPDCIVDICSTVAAMTMMGSVPMLWMTTLPSPSTE